MDNFDWKPEFSVSVSILDAQHRRIFALVRNLQNAIQEGRGQEVLGHCLRDLIAYAQTHLFEEEDLLTRHDYPDIAQHRLQHSEFIKQITEFERQFDGGDQLRTTELINFITSWITDHVLQTDRRYADFFNRLGVY